MNSLEAEKILELKRPYTQDEFNAAYRKAVKKHHPDVGGDTKTMEKVNAARAVINKNFAGKPKGYVVEQSTYTSGGTSGFNTAYRTTHTSASNSYEDEIDFDDIFGDDEEFWEVFRAPSSSSSSSYSSSSSTQEEEVDTSSPSYRIYNRLVFEVNGKTYKFVKLRYSVLARFAVMLAIFILSIVYMNTAALEDMSSAIDIMWNAICMNICGLLFGGWISRRILLLFKRIVRRKDAWKIYYREKEKEDRKTNQSGS